MWVHGPDIEQISQAATVALIDGDLERAERITDQIDDKWHGSIVRNLYLVPLRLGIATCRGRQTRYLDQLERLHRAGEADYAA